MRTLISFIVISFVGGTVWAAEPKGTATQPTAKSSQTNMSFDELLIQGQYHFSDEAVVTVEDDKVLDALLGVRKDFKDRIQQSSTR